MGIQVFTDRTLRERDKEKLQRITELEQQVTRLTAQNKMLSEEKERMELTWKTNYYDVQARYELLHATLGEMEQAQGELGLLFDKTATFLRRVAKGENIRSQQTGGRALIEQAKALLVQYGESGDKQVIGK